MDLRARFSSVLEHDAAGVRMSLNHQWRITSIDPQEVQAPIDKAADARRNFYPSAAADMSNNSHSINNNNPYASQQQQQQNGAAYPRMFLVPFLAFEDETIAPRDGTSELLGGFSIGYAAMLKRAKFFYAELPPPLVADEALLASAAASSGRKSNSNNNINAAANSAQAANSNSTSNNNHNHNPGDLGQLVGDELMDDSSMLSDPSVLQRERLKVWCKRCVQHVLEDPRVVAIDGNKRVRKLRTRPILTRATNRLSFCGNRYHGFRFSVTYEQRSEMTPVSHAVALCVCVGGRGYLFLVECVNEHELHAYVAKLLHEKWLNDEKRLQLGAEGLARGYSECQHQALQMQQLLFGELYFRDNDGAFSFRLPMHSMVVRPDHSPTVPPGPGSLCCVTLELTIHQKLLDELDDDEAVAAGGRTRQLNVTVFVEVEDLLKDLPPQTTVFSGDEYSRRRHERFADVFRDVRVLGLPLSVPIGKRTGRSTTCSFATMMGDHQALVKSTSVTTLVGSRGATATYFTKLGQGQYDSYLYIFQHVLNSIAFFSERDVSGTFSRYRSVPVRIAENDLMACYTTDVADPTARTAALQRHMWALRASTDGEVEGVTDVVYVEDDGRGGELRASVHHYNSGGGQAQQQQQRTSSPHAASASTVAPVGHAFSDNIPDESGAAGASTSVPVAAVPASSLTSSAQQSPTRGAGANQFTSLNSNSSGNNVNVNLYNNLSSITVELVLDDSEAAELDTVISVTDIGRIRDLVDLVGDEEEDADLTGPTRVDGGGLGAAAVAASVATSQRVGTPHRPSSAGDAAGAAVTGGAGAPGAPASAQPPSSNSDAAAAAAAGAAGESGAAGAAGAAPAADAHARQQSGVAARSDDFSSAALGAGDEVATVDSQDLLRTAAAGGGGGGGAAATVETSRRATATSAEQLQQSPQQGAAAAGGPTKQQLQDLADALEMIGGDEEQKRKLLNDVLGDTGDDDGKSPLLQQQQQQQNAAAARDGGAAGGKTSAAALSNNSLRNAYIEICKEEDCRPNSYLVQKLPVIPRLTQTIEALDMSHNYVGHNGFYAILRLLALMPKVNTVLFNSMSLDNNDVALLCEELLAHRTIHTIHLRNNPRITLPAAKSLMKLLRENVCVTTLSLTGTGMGMQLQRKIEAEAERNKEYSFDTGAGAGQQQHQQPRAASAAAANANAAAAANTTAATRATPGSGGTASVSPPRHEASDDAAATGLSSSAGSDQRLQRVSTQVGALQRQSPTPGMPPPAAGVVG